MEWSWQYSKPSKRDFKTREYGGHLSAKQTPKIRAWCIQYTHQWRRQLQGTCRSWNLQCYLFTRLASIGGRGTECFETTLYVIVASATGLRFYDGVKRGNCSSNLDAWIADIVGCRQSVAAQTYFMLTRRNPSEGGYDSRQSISRSASVRVPLLDRNLGYATAC